MESRRWCHFRSKKNDNHNLWLECGDCLKYLCFGELEWRLVIECCFDSACRISTFRRPQQCGKTTHLYLADSRPLHILCFLWWSVRNCDTHLAQNLLYPYFSVIIVLIGSFSKRNFFSYSHLSSVSFAVIGTLVQRFHRSEHWTCPSLLL